ncbi:dUTP diphosphatase [Limibaculum sp. M0105]|uniref:Deoxyuridine 5'-triphosphate nucleotidohydrolase n=1 Tax=Thermohalobaculum xanthum TaxID=2753746 RepID=A0A8J7M7Y2_9RHOB|nr:dUTP diphosphatase [Thermohalobaculum xanthum]MBK0400004.1 dUTP diphosphatase [Thermohalobaculum xanthum]
MTLILRVARLEHHDPALPLPQYETAGAAGMDLRASLMPGERAAGLALPQMGRVLVPTGLAVAIPEGFEGQVRPRSGLAARHGVTVLNAPGTIDSDYRGELRVLLVNLGPETFRIRHGERIAQLVIAPVTRADVEAAAVLDETVRGAGGFGSTGRG